jgi:hypothetical protein
MALTKEIIERLHKTASAYFRHFIGAEAAPYIRTLFSAVGKAALTLETEDAEQTTFDNLHLIRIHTAVLYKWSQESPDEASEAYKAFMDLLYNAWIPLIDMEKKDQGSKPDQAAFKQATMAATNDSGYWELIDQRAAQAIVQTAKTATTMFVGYGANVETTMDEKWSNRELVLLKLVDKDKSGTL